MRKTHLIYQRPARRLSLLVMIACFCAAGFWLSTTQNAYAQNTAAEEEFELILQVQRGKEIWNPAMLGFERGFDRFYIPVVELGRLVRFQTEYNPDTGTLRGWFFDPANTYEINPADPSYTIRGERVDMDPDDVIVKQFSADYAEVYVRLEQLNKIWPLDLSVDFKELALNIDTFTKLPYEIERERQKRQKAFLDAQGNVIDTEGFTVIDKPYQAISKPVLDLNSSVQKSATEDDISSTLNVQGRNDLLGFSADYSAQFRYDDNKLDLPDNIRLTLKRQAFGGKTMPLGIRQLRLGDVSAPSPNLVGGSNGGVGVVVSSNPVKRNVNFDEVVIEGVSTPGWDIELYRNEILIEFAKVNNNGIYRFDNVALLTGNNIFRVMLYGPQGEVEERVETYSIGGNLLSPGTTEYDAAIVETDDDLIRFEDNGFTRRTSVTEFENDSTLSYSANVRHGLNRNITVSAGGTRAQSRQGAIDYLNAGADFSAGRSFGNVELYKQLDGGHALSGRLATSLQGWRVNLRTSLMSDFESDQVGFGDSATIFDFETRIGRRFSTPIGGINVDFSSDHEHQENDLKLTRYNFSTGLTRSSYRLGNALRSTYINQELSSFDGTANASFSVSPKISNRTLLNYRLRPEQEFTDLNTNFYYYPTSDLRAGLELGRNLIARQNRVGADLNYDFGTVSAGINTRWTEESGVSVALRASTSLAPFGQDGDYIMSSKSQLSNSAVNARVFQDNNLNNQFDEGDMLLEETGLKLNGFDFEETNVDGQATKIVSEIGAYQALQNDTDISPNPFLVPATKGQLVFLRPAITQNVDIAMIESGVMEGNAYFENGNPIPGLKLRLRDNNGTVLQSTTTSFDGYYAFDFVIPGTYIVDADPQMNVLVPPRILTISQDALFAYGADVQMKASPQSDIQVSEANATQNRTAILGTLQRLQSTLQQASVAAPL